MPRLPDWIERVKHPLSEKVGATHGPLPQFNFPPSRTRHADP
jgi:hypothetical protein